MTVFSVVPGKTLNLGAGSRIVETAINHDRIKHRPEIDVAHDLEDAPWPWADDSFERILMWDVLEHLPRPIRAIEELWRISEPNGEVWIHVPWAGPQVGAREVWRDPTHIRPYHELSFHYFDPDGGKWFDEYGAFYSHARFHIETVRPDPPDNILFVLRTLKG